MGVLLSIALLLSSSSGVLADNFGTDDATTGPFADGAGHSHCWGPGFPDNLKDNVHFAMVWSLDDGTEMWDVYHASCTVETDVYWLQADLPGAVRGQYRCSHYVRLRHLSLR